MIYAKKNQLSKRRQFGHVSIDISTLPKINFMKILPLEKTESNSQESLCVSIDYKEEKILPLDLYYPLFNSVQRAFPFFLLHFEFGIEHLLLCLACLLDVFKTR